METSQMVLLSDRLEYGMRLREQRTGQAVNWADCARAAGVSAQAVYLWRQNETAISSKHARTLANYFGVDALWMETGYGSPDRERNLKTHVQSEELISEQLAALIRHFFSATPYGRDQLLDFAAVGIEKYSARAVVPNAGNE